MIVVNKVSILNREIFRFSIVGVINTLNYAVLFVILQKIIHYQLAHIVAFLVSAFISYFLTCIYTFKDVPTLSNLIKFPITFFPNLVASTFLTVLFVEVGILEESTASIIIMLCSVPVTFLINKIIFKNRR